MRERKLSAASQSSGTGCFFHEAGSSAGTHKLFRKAFPGSIVSPSLSGLCNADSASLIGQARAVAHSHASLGDCHPLTAYRASHISRRRKGRRWRLSVRSSMSLARTSASSFVGTSTVGLRINGSIPSAVSAGEPLPVPARPYLLEPEFTRRLLSSTRDNQSGICQKRLTPSLTPIHLMHAARL